MPDRSADLSFETPDGADFSLVWGTRGACISVGGDQPMDQPPCSITLDRAQLARLRDEIAAPLFGRDAPPYSGRETATGIVGFVVGFLSGAIVIVAFLS